MINVRKSEDRGFTDRGWLQSSHTFSFTSYFDPDHSKFRSLRVLNEDWIQAGQGFDSHPHENMEIITYVVDGELVHKDSTGMGTVIHRGELQRMTAGTGITHSEFNQTDLPTHLIQIWIRPERADLEPEYEQRDFSNHWRPNALTLIASQTGEKNSVTLHQDVDFYAGLLSAEHRINYEIAYERHIWLQLIKGSLELNNIRLNPGDGAGIEHETDLSILAKDDSEFLLFDLA